MTKEQVRAFLEQPEIQLLVEDEELEEVYNKCDSRGRKDLTEYLLSIGVQPDEYMKNIPSDFLNQSQISSYDISSTVSVIGVSAFCNCKRLTRITIPDGVTTIRTNAFYNCKSLNSVKIPNGVTEIGEYAFCDCISLTSMTIPDSVTSIGDSAFYNCNRLTSVTIGNGVTSIGIAAFYSCGELEIYYNGTLKQWEAITRGEVFKYTSCVVHCADGDIVID